MTPKERDALTDWIGDQVTAKELLGLLPLEDFKTVARFAVDFLEPEEPTGALKRALEKLP